MSRGRTTSEIRANSHRAEAYALRKAAEHHDRDADTLDGIGKANAMRLNIARSLNTALNHIENGMTREDAFFKSSITHAVSIATIALHYDCNVKMQAQIERCARDREINRLARSGLTNDELSRRFNLHTGSISRIISKGRRS
jgi:hypothetical protein